jgi:hypothetical protein
VRLVWNRLWATVVAFGVVISIIAALVSKDVRHAIRDAWEWFYPGPLVTVLVLVVAGLVAALATMRRRHAAELGTMQRDHATALAEAQRARDTALAEAERDRVALTEAKVYADEQARAHDERLFAETRRLVPRKAITWLEGQDFTGPVLSRDVITFTDFALNRDMPELAFNDPELEARREAFYRATWTWASKLGEYTRLVNDNVMRVRRSVDVDPAGEDEEFSNRAAELDALAGTVAEAYDALIASGRARGFDLLGE